MPRSRATQGTCAFCAESVTSRGGARHRSSCLAYQTALRRAGESRRKAEPLFQLRAHDTGGELFWLELEMRGSATLKELDDYLRAIWLECCGHMSRFSIGGWRGDEIPRSRRVASVCEPGVELTHIYDFGTESDTRIEVTGVREGRPLTAHPITLLARNVMPGAACLECGAPAGFLCIECVTDHVASGLLCDAHAETHPHDEYGQPLPLVNSPRLGLCGYTGPAKAPY